MIITGYRLKILAKIESLSVETGVTSAPDIAQAVETKPSNVRSMLTKLKESGWIENPHPACWRLTSEGKKLLIQMRNEREAI